MPLPSNLFADRLPELEARRVRLRHPRPDDVEAVFAVFGNEHAMRYWSHEAFERREQAETYLGEIDQGFADRTLFQWAVTEHGADELIGTVTLTEWSERNRRMEVGYMLHPVHWGKGYASEAVRTVLQFGFEQIGLHRVEAELDPRNEASARLLEKLGFQKEGLLRERWWVYEEWCDSALYGLLRTDFDASARDGLV